MKKFLLKLVLFAAVIFIVDKAFIIVRNAQAEYDHDRRLELVLNGELSKDLIVIGSSRADANIATWILEEELGLDSYNLSYGGSEIELQTFILKKLIQYNTKPKVIVKLIDDDFELTYNPCNTFRTDRLLPLTKYEDIRDELVKRGEMNLILSKLFILTHLNKSSFDFRKTAKINDTIAMFGNITKSKKAKNKDFNWNKKTSQKYNTEEELKDKHNAFLEFQKICLDNNIKLVLALPPSYNAINNGFLKRIKELKLKNTLLHIYNEEENYRQQHYFNDNIHLNKKGSNLYTKELADYLSTVL